VDGALVRDKWAWGGAHSRMELARWRWMLNRSSTAALLIDDCIFGRSDTTAPRRLLLLITIADWPRPGPTIYNIYKIRRSPVRVWSL